MQRTLIISVSVIGFMVVAPLLAGGLSPALTSLVHAEDSELPRDKKAEKKLKKVFKKTRKGLDKAQAAAKEGGKMIGRLRTAVIHQRAAHLALAKNNYALAAYLTLESRKYAGHVIKANKAKKPKELENSGEEADLALGSDEAEAGSLVKAVEMGTPAEELILENLDVENPE